MMTLSKVKKHYDNGLVTGNIKLNTAMFKFSYMTLQTTNTFPGGTKRYMNVYGERAPPQRNHKL